MASTKIADIIIPEVFHDYVTVRTPEKSRLVRSGIVTPDSSIDDLAKKGGLTIQMPYFNDLSGASEVLSDSAPLTVGKITSGRDAAGLIMRGKAWGVNDLAKALSGADPMGAIADLVAEYWVREEQAMLISMLNGVFASASMAVQTLDVAKADTGADGSAAVKVQGSVMIDAMTLLGDNADLLTAICMHSQVCATLQKNNLIEYVEESDAKIKIPYYMGREVIIDDGCPVINNVTNGKKFVTYLFGKGAIARGEGSAPTPVETDRDSLAGEDVLIHRRHLVLHSRGVKWLGAVMAKESPSNAELANGSNWNRVYPDKTVRIVKLVTNG